MKKIISYVHFTKPELENYTSDTSSCIERKNNTMHIDFPPWGMNNFKDALVSSVAAKKIGNFDAALDGIVLDVKNIKLQGDMNLVRYDAPELHLTIRADFYVFKPKTDAILKGTVNHVSRDHISVVIYRVFNVSIKLAHAHARHRLRIGDEITFKVKKFDLQNILPYIEGDLMDRESSMDSGVSGSGTKDNDANSPDWDLESGEESNKRVAVKTEKNRSTTDQDSTSSDEEEDHKTKIRKAIAIKEEPKTPSASPEKTKTKKDKKRISINEEVEDDVRGQKKGRTARFVEDSTPQKRRNKDSSDTDFSSSGEKRKRPQTPAKSAKGRTSPSSSDSEEFATRRDMDSSVEALVNRIKKEKASSSASEDNLNLSGKKSRKDLSLTIDSPLLSSTKIEDSTLTTKKSKSKKK